MRTPLKNKVIIITGASSGIGKALALEASTRGARIVAAARNPEKLQQLVQECTFPENVLCVPTDVSQEAECKALIEKAIEKFGTIHILLNNAGISMRASFDNVELNVVQKLMDVNFWGTVYCTKYAYNELIKNQGSLVGISSIAGYIGLPGRTGYSASKFALQGFLEVIRNENVRRNLHVLIVCPGYTESNIRNTALKADGSEQGQSPRKEERMMSAAKVARIVLNGVERRRKHMVLTPMGKVSVFIKKLFPRFMGRIAYKAMEKEPDSPFK